MINDGLSDVPEKTIAIFPFLLEDNSYVDMDRIKNIIEKSEIKRDWFTPHFYRCLPLTIGNTYGFLIKSEFDFGFEWDGSSSPDGVKIFINEPQETVDKKYPRIESHFGNGIITVSTPFFLRTPPGINLMTVSPPNYILPNITFMTGVVETDNLRRDFTFNLKIQIPNIRVNINAGTPIAAFIPIPRYFVDSFELQDAAKLFTKEILDEEYAAKDKAYEIRNHSSNKKLNVDRDYYQGRDSFGNSFKDHQKP